MSSTPLFDSIARRTDPSVPAQTASAPSIARATFTPAPAPTSPMSPPVDTADAVQVPAALVAAIEDVPARVAAAMQNEHVVSAEQLVLVEAVADAITRAVVDAVATELERIARDGIVRA
ncbi:hypothetical protein GCM10017714_20500 [Curtobacterium pusillum]|uniref:Uncharacterized protein n=1 Tax=Curtobacterium pusillum TaxID=69373 RepID=A0ABX2M9D3_9MICO|nr:hypothetical protein [Curtobacterium pusillum]NUU14657.1 hypothetical protein [Curtobacterium pusillum]GLK31909.1 hypothetical protein GCM10017610_21940 [Curtobacterium pusillum]